MAWMVFDYPEPHWTEEREPVCPVCGGVCAAIYRDRYYEVVGCEECVTVHDAWETEDCFV